MYTLTSFHYSAKNEVCESHVMMFVQELNSYVHIWDIEKYQTKDFYIKMNVVGTTKSKRITSKKVTKNLVDLANKMINDNKQEIEKSGSVNIKL